MTVINTSRQHMEAIIKTVITTSAFQRIITSADELRRLCANVQVLMIMLIHGNTTVYMNIRNNTITTEGNPFIPAVLPEKTHEKTHHMPDSSPQAAQRKHEPATIMDKYISWMNFHDVSDRPFVATITNITSSSYGVLVGIPLT
jgi:hypothetical protein